MRFIPHGKFLRVFLFFGVLFSASATSAQADKIAFEKYGVEEGLPEEYVRSLLQDDQGFIWIATQNGIVRYDGYEFEVFRGVSADSPTGGIQMRGGSRMIKSANGELWICNHTEGLAEYNPATGEFRNFSPNPGDPLQLPYDGGIRLLFEDTEGHIWFESHSVTADTSALGRLDPKTGQTASYPYSWSFAVLNDIIMNLHMALSESDSSIWQITFRDRDLMRLNRAKDEFELVLAVGDTIPGTEIKDSLNYLVTGNDGRLLTFSRHGLYVWDAGRREVVQTYTNLPGRDSTLAPYAVHHGFEDDRGFLWVVYEDGKLTRIDPKAGSSEHYEFGEGQLDVDRSLEDVYFISPLVQDTQEILFAVLDSRYISTLAYLKYDHTAQRFKYYDHSFNDEGNHEVFRERPFWDACLVDHTGLLWLGTRPNLYKEAPESRQIELYRHDPEDPATIPSDEIKDFLEDSRGRLWIGTRNGLAMKAEDDSFQELFYRRNNKYESLGNIVCIYQDVNDRIWAGTWNNGLFRFDESSQEFRRIDLSPYISTSMTTPSVMFLFEDDRDNLWISIRQHGILVLDPVRLQLVENYAAVTADQHGLTSDFLLLAHKDSRGEIWVGDSRENDHGLFKFMPDENRFKAYTVDNEDRTSIMSFEMRFITEDDLGRIWIGTDGGVCIYDPETDGFERNHDRLKIPSVASYRLAGNGRMWMTTYSGGGLALVGPGINDVEIYGEEHGLLHNDGCELWVGLSIDNNGKLWLPNRRGLSVFDTHKRSFMSYFEKDGFQSYGRRYRTSITRDGNIWIGGGHGLNRIDPDLIAKKDSTLPHIVITGMGILDSSYSGADGDLFEQPVSHTDHVSLDHMQRDLTFEFVALHYASPEDNMYSWKLENYDRDWSAPSRERKASYTNLSPGEYTFRVKGSNADGIWNEEGARINVTIRPPWWRTWWAYGLYALLAGLILYRLHLYQKAKTQENERKKVQERELKQAREIRKAYAELKATQEQLIHSEKMASLGELTAGIAHEIQNPLNFVNNFSDVSKELLEEMLEELKNGDTEEVDTIAHDLVQNLEKIGYHGKRADSIVKGMLQHSRNSDGEKQAIDINALADEYLRLAYHGLRAKDKTFNANLVTEFDESLGKVDIVPQDIGRVLLNLLTNAFHAVNEKKINAPEGYQPEVVVRTRKSSTGVEIDVTDNGNGIPENVKEKIFQPFFTTKPTGQGTGLGLSMSYDIVTKGHSGKLTVTSREGEGTTFTVRLPESRT